MGGGPCGHAGWSSKHVSMSWRHKMCSIHVFKTQIKLTLCLQDTKRAHFTHSSHKIKILCFQKIESLISKKIYKRTPPLISSFFWKSQVGRKTTLTKIHKYGSENEFFLYYHGVANNLGMADLSCRLLVVEIQPKWNGPSDGWSVFWKYIHSGVVKKVLRMGSAYSGKCSHTPGEYF